MLKKGQSLIDSLRDLFSNFTRTHRIHKTDDKSNSGEQHLQLAKKSLRDLLEDERIPEQIRDALTDDYQEVQLLLERLEQGHIQIAAFGRVSVGKSALLNALMGKEKFSTSPLHGETKSAQPGQWTEYHAAGVTLVDTPGINEAGGAEKEQLAKRVASQSDLILFVVDSDLTETELKALTDLATYQRPLLLVLNKLDRYTEDERADLLKSLKMHCKKLVEPQNILLTAAQPARQIVIQVDQGGKEKESTREMEKNITALKTRLWEILDKDGKTLAALNAALFAGQLSDQVGERMLQARHHLGQRLIRNYCISKGVAVALNPIPIADLVAAAAVDVSMLVHLSHVYKLPLTKSEAGTLLKTIGAQMVILMGTVWAVHFESSALKLGTGGLSTLVTGSAQGAVAYYSTYVVGQAAERFLAQGKSWGEGGPKYVVREILDKIDRNSILNQAKADILERLS
jgi:small GTP-binding protein